MYFSLILITNVLIGYAQAQDRVCVTKTEGAAIKSSLGVKPISKPTAVSGSGECVGTCTGSCKSVAYLTESKLCTQYGRSFEESDLDLSVAKSTVFQLRPDSECPAGGNPKIDLGRSGNKQKAQRVPNTDDSIAKAAVVQNSQAGYVAPNGYGKPPAPEWNPWKPWSTCSASCGAGVKYRTRTCNGYGCPGSDKETNICEGPPCCTEWTKWDTCSSQCGQGTQERTRQCGGGYGGPAGGAEVEKQSQACTNGQTPQYGSWEAQGSCSVTCGTGTIKHNRQCSTFGTSAYGTPACQCDGPSEKQEPCQMPACCTEWTDWGKCPNPCGSGTQTRTRTCGGGGQYGAGKVETDSKSCNGGPSPTYGSWEPQGSCSVTCGTGTIKHNRQCSTFGTSAYGTPACQCDGPSEKQEPCQMPACCTEWTDWGKCPNPCGSGTQTRTRTCGGGGQYGAGKVETDSKSCNGGPSPTYGSWQQQGSCSVTCGTGTIKHNRQCSTFGTSAYGTPACQCDGPSEKQEPCQMPACCTEWTDWGKCDNPCGSGTQTRTRTCGGGGQYGAGKTETDTKSCSGGPSPTYGPWAPQGSCSVTCGQGTITHQRQCSTYGSSSYGQCPCDGASSKQETCNPGPCPPTGYVAPKYGEFYANRNQGKK